ncbi:MAG: ThuA domain-containing protein, partial [Candidatus Korobacteraceae bacterium]
LGIRLRGKIDSGMLQAIHHAGVKPLFVTVEYNGPGDPVLELSQALDSFEDAFRPVATARLAEIGRTVPTQGWAKISEQDKAKVIAAVPANPPAKPRKTRKVLVVDLSIGHPHHPSVPFANFALQQWGTKTQAFTPVFSNDPENLKYPRIGEYDTVFLNNTVGQVFLDPQVRTSLIRFVREGGGLVGFHGVAAASLDWSEFSDMTGARLESRGARPLLRPYPDIKNDQQKAALKVEVPGHPLTEHLGGKPIEWLEEYYTFEKPTFSRDRVRVLLSIDFPRTDMSQCSTCSRDDDVPVAWIRNFGKGRVFYTVMGHWPYLFETPEMARFMFAGLQFALGDLEADASPQTADAATR